MRWLADLRASWEGADASDATVARLFSADAVYCPDPLAGTELAGRAAIQGLWTQDDADLGRPRVRIGEPLVEWPRAMVAWWANFGAESDPPAAETGPARTGPGGEGPGGEASHGETRGEGAETLAGMFSLLFDEDGRCRRLVEAWMRTEEARQPPASWPL